MLEIRSPNSWKVSFLVLLTNPFPSISILTSLISKRFLLFFIFYHLYEYSLLYWFASSRTTTISSKWVYGSLTRNGLMECGTDCPSTWLSRNEKSQIPKYHLFGSRKKCSSTLLCFRIIWIITPMRSNTSFRILLHPVPIPLTLKALTLSISGFLTNQKDWGGGGQICPPGYMAIGGHFHYFSKQGSCLVC